MRSKSLFLIPLIVIGAGGTYALVANLFPDTALMPRIPMQVGTLGYTIAKVLGVTDLVNYTGDGTARNSSALGGVAGSGYLQNMDCSAGYVWTRIDSTGRAVCELKSGDLLAKLGTMQEINGVTEIQRVGSTDFITANVGDEMIEGDIIRTAPGARASIAFVDGSILRLDIDTTVELSVGKNSSNQAIAQVILNNGALWGRVLTSTGMNIGTKEFIAGVRGTSVSVKQNSSYASLSVVQSQNSPAATLTVSGSSSTVIGTGATFTVYDPKSPGGATFVTPGIDGLYTQTWIRDNVLKDIDYMSTLTGSSDLALRDKAARELAITLPTSSSESDALCADDGSQVKLVFWSSLVGTNTSKCQDESLVAFADYTKNTNTLYQKTGEVLQANTNAVTEIDRGITIGSGQYLRYDATYLLGFLSGKSVTVEFSNTVTTGSKKYLADFGNNVTFYFDATGNKKCGFRASNICQTGDFEIIPGTNNYTIRIPTTAISQIVIGNTSAGYILPISTPISKISIKG